MKEDAFSRYLELGHEAQLRAKGVDNDQYPEAAISVVLWIDGTDGSETTTLTVADNMTGTTAVGLLESAKHSVLHETQETL